MKISAKLYVGLIFLLVIQTISASASPFKGFIGDYIVKSSKCIANGKQTTLNCDNTEIIFTESQTPNAVVLTQIGPRVSPTAVLNEMNVHNQDGSFVNFFDGNGASAASWNSFTNLKDGRSGHTIIKIEAMNGYFKYSSYSIDNFNHCCPV